MKRLLMLLMILLLSGCTSMFNSMNDKSVNSGVDIYGLKLTAFDPSTGSLSPTGFVGMGGMWYNSCPVKKGQNYRVVRMKKSFWTGDYSEVVVIEVTNSKFDGELKVNGKDILSIPLEPKAKFIKKEEK